MGFDRGFEFLAAAVVQLLVGALRSIGLQVLGVYCVGVEHMLFWNRCISFVMMSWSLFFGLLKVTAHISNDL